MGVILVGLGGNVGDVTAALAEAVRRLRAMAEVAGVDVSPLYETAPSGPIRDQPRFLNACARLRWRDGAPPPEPVALVRRLREIERALGRRREAETPQGPRAIDLDLLTCGELVGEWPGPPAVTLPHPRLAQRRFVLAPLADLVGEAFVLPGLGRATVGELLRGAEARHPDETVRRVGELIV